MAKPKKSKQFLYRLQAVLKVREIREEQEKEKLREAERKLVEEKKKEEEIKDFQNEKYSELREIMTGEQGNTDLQELMLRRAHLEVVKEQVIQQEKVREDAEQKKEEQRESVVEAVKDKKIMETDKENKRVEWKKMMDKEESKFLDDISSVAYSKKKKELLEELGET
jgi:flagellar export protein FliJ